MNNIWNLNDAEIPLIYETENYNFKCPANIQVNLEEQIQLSNEIVFALQPGKYLMVI